MRVDSHDYFERIADFDPSTGSLQERNRGPGDGLLPMPTEGHYSRCPEARAVLYRSHARLWLRIGDVVRNLDDLEVEVNWTHARGYSELQLVDRGVVVAELRYRSSSSDGAGDPTPFAESEDWDFGLFVKNVLTNEGRRARIYGGASEA